MNLNDKEETGWARDEYIATMRQTIKTLQDGATTAEEKRRLTELRARDIEVSRLDYGTPVVFY